MEVFELDYSVYSPGGLINVDERLSYKKYTSSGSFNMTYVTYRKGTIMNLLIAKIIPTFDIIKNEDLVLTNEDVYDMIHRDNIQIIEAISNATYISFKEANKKIDIINEDDYIYYVAPFAVSNLKVGDKIIECDNKKINNYEEIYNCIHSHAVGEELELKVVRNNKEVKTKSTVGEDNIIGFVMKRIFTFDSDPIINYKHDNNESGSSGGLMLALSMYNSLVEDDITKGKKIAGTGTIELDGTVGEISGVKYKIKGAVKNKVDLFIVPDANYDEAEQVIKDNNFNLKLLKATDFKQVLNDLRAMN